jgi:hypothetical protein
MSAEVLVITVCGVVVGWAIGQVCLFFWIDQIFDFLDRTVGPPFERLLDKIGL